MSKKLSVTVYPAPLSGTYLTVSDALNQVLDFISALELSETTNTSERQVVWRLADAHTKSPPFAIVAEPFPAHADLSGSLEANRVIELFTSKFKSLLEGCPSQLTLVDARGPIERILDRNLNGIARTDLQIDDDETISVEHSSARLAKLAIERSGIDPEGARPDFRRTEMGSLEGDICGVTRWNGRPALEIIERLSKKRFTCLLNNELSEELGPSHQWNEVWEGRLVRVTGALHYNSKGDLRRADIRNMEQIEWSNVPLTDIGGIDILGKRTLTEHLDLIRGDSNG